MIAECIGFIADIDTVVNIHVEIQRQIQRC